MLKRIVFVVSLMATPAVLFGQASPTASRAGDLQIGGGFSNANTDYVPNRVNGGTVYVDFDFYHHLGVEGEFRFVKDSPTNIYEKTYEIGGRYSRVYHNSLVPYGKLMYGRGVFNFASYGQTTANLAYNMFAGGVGVDYRLMRRVNVRVEYEAQRWLGFPSHGLTPSAITFGAAYHFPAGKLSLSR